MITTEEQLVYQILNTVNAGEINDDDRKSERLIRGYIQKHRGLLMDKYYSKGLEISDEVFQPFSLTFIKNEPKQFIFSIPKIHLFKDNFGIKLSKNDVDIPVINSTEYRLSLKGAYGKFHPKAMITGDKLYIYKGVIPCQNSGSNYFTELVNYLNHTSKPNIDANGVLVNLDIGIGYDWTKSSFPFPNEAMSDLMQSILAREFNILIGVNPDQIGNANANANLNAKIQEQQ